LQIMINKLLIGMPANYQRLTILNSSSILRFSIVGVKSKRRHFRRSCSRLFTGFGITQYTRNVTRNRYVAVPVLAVEKSRTARFTNSRPRTARGYVTAYRLRRNDSYKTYCPDSKPPTRQPRSRVHGKRPLATIVLVTIVYALASS
jgi:hypothetical protein